MMHFHDRSDAGKQLAKALSLYKGKPDTIVLALPRGGVPPAYEIAQALLLPLDILLVRKLGMPGHEELAMGAIASGGVRVLNEDIVHGMSIPESVIADVAAEEQAELNRREQAYRGGRPAPDLEHKTVILVDDGMATGANMRAAVESARRQQAAQIIVAVPVASDSACDSLSGMADGVVCLFMPEPFYGVGRFYQDFSQTSDAEVKALLKKAHIPVKQRRHA